MVTIPPRKDEDEAVEKPVMITDYNQSKGGVDLCDELLNYYAFSRKTRKWWKKLFFRLLELCIINSMILYKARNPGFAKRHMAQKIFRETLALQLVQLLVDKQAEPSATVFAPKRGRSSIGEYRLKGMHLPSTSTERKRCVVCSYQNSSNGKYKDTKTYKYCQKCGKHICTNCFEMYHT